ncbi:MAG: CBS domain-containing protein [Syntrophales bacterium]
MEEKHVKDIMIPIEDYAVVSQDATIKEAMKIMKETSEKLSPGKYKHLGVLVKDQEGKIIGKLTQADILRGLEPQYKDIGGSYLSPLIREEMGDAMAHLPDRTFFERCRAHSNKKVRAFMTTIALSVDIREDLSHAVHVMLISDHRGLLVVEGKKPVGVLRLTDIYQLVKQTILEE